MKTLWTKGSKNPKEIALHFKEAHILRERLVVMLEEKIDSEIRERLNKSSYTSPSWALRQADSLGYMRALKEAISLLIEGKEDE